MVHPETDVGEDNPHGRAKQDVEAVMPIVHPPRHRDEKGRGGRDKGDDHQQDRRRRTARANRGPIIGTVLAFDGEVR